MILRTTHFLSISWKSPLFHLFEGFFSVKWWLSFSPFSFWCLGYCFTVSWFFHGFWWESLVIQLYFFGCFQNIIFTFGIQKLYYRALRCGNFFVYVVWDSLNSLNLENYDFNKTGKFPATISSNHFLFCFLFCVLPGNPITLYKTFLHCCTSPWTLFLFHPSSLCFSNSINSVDLWSSSLTLLCHLHSTSQAIQCICFRYLSFLFHFKNIFPFFTEFFSLFSWAYFLYLSDDTFISCFKP